MVNPKLIAKIESEEVVGFNGRQSDAAQRSLRQLRWSISIMVSR